MMAMMLIPLLLLSGAGKDMLSLIETQMFWKELEVQVTEDNMLQELQPVKTDQNVDELIAKLGAADFDTREAATEELAKLGVAAKDALLKASTSDNAEVAERAKFLLEELELSNKIAPFRRLMAIRTLGELKSQKALPVLAKLSTSNTAFEAEYAKRAIAQIKGQKYEVKTLTMADIKGDVALLPEETGIVLQAVLPSDMNIDLSGMMKQFDPNADADQMKEQMAEQLFMVMMEVGNFRVDSMTMGIHKDTGEQGGWAIMIFRGIGDQKQFTHMLTSNGMEADENGFYMVENEMAILPKLDKGMLILMAGPRGTARPINEMVSALKTGQGMIHKNEKLMKMIAEVPNKEQSIAWAAGFPSEDMREDGSPLGPFEEFTAFLKKNEDGSILGKVSGSGEDAEMVTELVTEMNETIAEGINQMEEFKDEMPMASSMIDFMKSIKISNEGKKAEMEVKFKNYAQMLIPMFGTMVPMRSSPGHRGEPMPDEEMEIMPEPVPGE